MSNQKNLREFLNQAAHSTLSEATFKVPAFKSDHDIETIFDDGEEGSIQKNIIKMAKILVPLAGLTGKKIKKDPKSFKIAYDVLRKLSKDPSGELWLGNFIDQTESVWKVVDGTLKSGRVTVTRETILAVGDLYNWASDSTDASWFPTLNDKAVKKYMAAYAGDYAPEYADEMDMDESKDQGLSEAIKNEDEFRTALAMTRIYDKASRLFDGWSRGANWDMLGYMAANEEDLTPAHKAELQKWATSFEKLADKLDAQLNRYEKG